MRTILEEKRLSTNGVVDSYPFVWYTLRFNNFDVFTRPRSSYIPTWIKEFYTTYGDLVPRAKKKANTLRSVACVIVQGRNMRCSSDDMNAALDRATRFDHDHNIDSR